MQEFIAALDAVNAVLLSVPVLLTLLAVGVLFTVWSGFGQYRALTHGFRLVRGGMDSGKGPGAISHFQALSAALSATVGLGNIAGVAIAVELGGPGAVFWMWVVGFFGMCIKITEVLLSMLYRNTDDPANPHGGTMWVAKYGLPQVFPSLAKAGGIIGALFCFPLILFAVTGGNMFQSWSVATTAEIYVGVPTAVTGVLLAVVVGLVILGGIRRIGQIAGLLVPFMCALYLICGIGVILVNVEQVPRIFALIFTSAFSPAEASGAFLGAGVGTAFIFGMKRALFSSEAGLGSAPIAHSAVRTREPATEGVVAGLEPFIDTLVVCTITALVILSSGAWERDAAAEWAQAPGISQVAAGGYAPARDELPAADFAAGQQVFVAVRVTRRGEEPVTKRIYGEIERIAGGQAYVAWRPYRDAKAQTVEMTGRGVFRDYPGAALTALAFDSVALGLGGLLVTLTVTLFAISTMITWSYYGEQGWIYLLGNRGIGLYRGLWCLLIILPCLGTVRTIGEIDTISTIALGFMLIINLPLMVLLGRQAMNAWHDYFRRLKSGEITEV